MTKLKLRPLVDDKPVKVSIEIPGPLYRDLVAYAELLNRQQQGQSSSDPAKLIVPILQRFITTDRGFAKQKRAVLGVSGASSQIPKIDE